MGKISETLAIREGAWIKWYLVSSRRNFMAKSSFSRIPASASNVSRSKDSSRPNVEETFEELARSLQAESPLPLYKQVADQITDWIETGRLREGCQLLSERTMAVTLGISRRTVRAALGALIDAHYVSATHGCGNFVLEPPRLRKKRILALERFHKEPVHLVPRHHDLIHQAESRLGVEVHYKYVPTADHLPSILCAPPSGYHGILLYRPPQDWIDVLVENESKIASKASLPLLVAGRSLAGTGYHYVSPDHFGQTHEAAKKLIAKGHDRIGYISGLISQDYMRLAYQGYEQALTDAGLALHKRDHLVLETFATSDTEMTIQKFLARRSFSALVVAGSAFSAAFENAVQRAAIHVPAELSVILVTEKSVLDALALRWTAHLYPDEVIPRSLEALSALAMDPTASPIQELIPFPEIAGVTCQAPVVQNVA